MDLPRNSFKHALAQRRPQIGLWMALANGYAAEICGGAGFDWVLIDGEHAPNTVTTVLAQLQALAPYPVGAVVRTASNDPVAIKQLLDIGAQSLLVPMIDSAEQAAAAVAAVRYPPRGIRGVGSTLARASRWNRAPDYLHRASDEICLMVQVESMQGISALQAILEVEGIDGVFVGPADLAASMGHLGNPAHPEVCQVVDAAIASIVASDKAAGILTASQPLARHYLELGAVFVAVGSDVSVLARGAEALAASFRERPPPPVVSGTY
jgi:4-hydroxy-2-oxoheptanedioate aldolase